MPEKVLLVGTLQTGDDVLVRHLGEQGFLLDCQKDAFEALNHIRSGNCDVLLVSQNLFGLSADELLLEAQTTAPGMPAFLLADPGRTIRSQKGIFEVLTRPWEPKVVEKCLRDALEEYKKEAPAQGKTTGNRSPQIVGESAAVKKLSKTIAIVAGKTCNVLISGETGSGKELVAKAIHCQSPRAARPLISINCGAIPENLLEDELFGHIKGAFTTAHTHRVGRFEQADKSTLFLDEIGTMNPDLQVKLLRVLEEREFQRLGSNTPVKVDVRILAATNADLPTLIQEKKFRADLYYRLNVFPILLPPLRERTEDIPLLIDHFLDRFCGQYQTAAKRVEKSALEMLMEYEWPGNIRELENVIESAVILSDDGPLIDIEHLQHMPATAKMPREEAPLPLPSPMEGELDLPEKGVDFQQIVGDLERQLILKGLQLCGGNRSKTAAYLNLKRTTLLEKLKRLQLE